VIDGDSDTVGKELGAISLAELSKAQFRLMLFNIPQHPGAS
jgi:hypothetical protein